jgi:hypothetical protein
VSQYQAFALITGRVRVFSAAGGWKFFGFIWKPKKIIPENPVSPVYNKPFKIESIPFDTVSSSQ